MDLCSRLPRLSAAMGATRVLPTYVTELIIYEIMFVNKRMFKIVVMKFIAPNIELIPARCRLKIAKSTEAPE